MALRIESRLIENARAGGAGLERLIECIWPEAYRIAFSILRDRGLAEDAAQDACAAMARSLDKLKDSSVFAAWSYKIIVNHAVTTGRRRPKTQALESVAQRAVHFDDSDAFDLYNALATLPLEQRAAIILHYYGGLKSREIAAATGVPSSTVRFYLMLARRSLRKALSAPNLQEAL
jgi:RNA polymerase sigma-70 factor (ECF subfamily)